MPDHARAVHAIMAALVARIGQTAAAHVIATAAGGNPDHGALSRKVHGTRGFTLEDLLALEAAGEGTPVTDYLADRREQRTAPRAGVLDAVAEAIREGGEAAAAAMRSVQTGSADDRVAAIREVREGITALQQVLAAVEAGSVTPIGRKGAV